MQQNKISDTLDQRGPIPLRPEGLLTGLMELTNFFHPEISRRWAVWPPKHFFTSLMLLEFLRNGTLKIKKPDVLRHLLRCCCMEVRAILESWSENDLRRAREKRPFEKNLA